MKYPFKESAKFYNLLSLASNQPQLSGRYLEAATEVLFNYATSLPSTPVNGSGMDILSGVSIMEKDVWKNFKKHGKALFDAAYKCNFCLSEDPEELARTGVDKAHETSLRNIVIHASMKLADEIDKQVSPKNIEDYCGIRITA